MILFAVHIALTIALLQLPQVAPIAALFGGPIGAMIAAFTAVYGALWALAALFGRPTRYFWRLWYALRLALFFVYDLIVSSVAVVWDIITPQQLSRPAIIDMPLDVKTDTEILLVTNLISLTPGTLSLDVTPDRSCLRIHAMFADDPDALIRDLKNGMERMVKEVFEA